MNSVSNFAFEEHLVRVVEHNGEPWFVASDVCRALGLEGGSSQHLRRLREKERGVIKHHTLGGEQTVSIISEPGVYRLTFRSNKASAERFQDFVFHEVLPSIRRTGQYKMPNAPANDVPAHFGEVLPVDRRQALAEVKEARIIFGAATARALWKQSPHLPRVPEMDMADRSIDGDDGSGCLRFLLEMRVDTDMRSIRDLLTTAGQGDGDALAALEALGLRLVEGGLWLNPTKPEMQSLWRRTKWHGGVWITHIRRLPGVTGGHPRTYIGGHQCRPIWVPASLLD